MKLTKTNENRKNLLPTNRLMLVLALGTVLTMSACSTVEVEPVNSDHPANTAALSAPEIPMSDTLNVKAIESTEAPVMDHSQHNM